MPSRDIFIKDSFLLNREGYPPEATEYWKHVKSSTWYRSARHPLTGKLILTSHPHDRVDTRISVLSASGEWPSPMNVSGSPIDELLDGNPRRAAYNEAYSRLRGKLYKGGAALGITLATTSEAKGIIHKRYQDLNQRASSLLAGKLRHVNAKNAAGAHLEIIFGWTPLITDIVAATTTLVQGAYPLASVTGRSKWNVQRSFRRTGPGGAYSKHQVTASGRVTLSALVEVDNPNLWLAERAGLLNPAAVAWDLVPWSFVVNMFVNTGSLVNSLTDYAGLNMRDCSTTYSDMIFEEVDSVRPVSYWYPKGSRVAYNVLYRPKTRRIHSQPPSPNLQFKLPGLSMGTIAMAASLFTQKFSKISAMVQPFLHKN